MGLDTRRAKPALRPQTLFVGCHPILPHLFLTFNHNFRYHGPNDEKNLSLMLLEIDLIDKIQMRIALKIQRWI